MFLGGKLWSRRTFSHTDAYDPALLSQDGLSHGILTTEPVDGDMKGGERALMERSLGDACNGGKASEGRIVTQRIKTKQKKVCEHLSVCGELQTEADGQCIKEYSLKTF